VSAGAGLAALSGIAAALAASDLLGRGLFTRGTRVARGLASLVDAVVTLGREGRDPGSAERRRLLLAGSGLALVTGWMARTAAA